MALPSPFHLASIFQRSAYLRKGNAGAREFPHQGCTFPGHQGLLQGSLSKMAVQKLQLPVEARFARAPRQECRCTPVQKFVIFSMQRTGSGWFETLLNSHPNVSSHGEIFSIEKRRENMSTIKKTLDTVYSLDWVSSASKNECTAAVGLKWMLNQGLMEYKREIAAYLKRNSVSVIFLFRRNILRRYVSILANTFDREKKQFNGTHRAHVHSEEEASLLAAYKPLVNLTSLITYMKRIEEIMLDSLLAFNGTRNMIVYYEDLVESLAELNRVQEFLHVECKSLESKHVKIHTLPLSGQIENWRDLSKRLKGTKYESFVN
ncbi:hypothetical protein L7F22_068687 [Adiantum nelumboides]|nr:hypothetical protein [Adiantum nelumboides]